MHVRYVMYPSRSIALLALVAMSAACTSSHHGTDLPLASTTLAAPSAAAPPSPAETAPPAASSVALDPRMRAWEAGRTYGYRLALQSRVALGGADPAFDFDLTGNLALIPIEVTSDAVTLYANIEHP